MGPGTPVIASPATPTAADSASTSSGAGSESLISRLAAMNADISSRPRSRSTKSVGPAASPARTRPATRDATALPAGRTPYSMGDTEAAMLGSRTRPAVGVASPTAGAAGAMNGSARFSPPVSPLSVPGAPRFAPLLSPSSATAVSPSGLSQGDFLRSAKSRSPATGPASAGLRSAGSGVVSPTSALSPSFGFPSSSLGPGGTPASTLSTIRFGTRVR
ncbi:hypothetical protein EON62_06005 [archaeon]|nr:MAG: hypothetical protein EON62_06005 [archaeon]